MVTGYYKYIYIFLPNKEGHEIIIFADILAKSQMTIQLWAQSHLEHSSVFSLSIDSMLQGVYGLFNDRVYRFILTISLSYVFSFSQC